jgi:hypothetical protein
MPPAGALPLTFRMNTANSIFADWLPYLVEILENQVEFLVLSGMDDIQELDNARVL